MDKFTVVLKKPTAIADISMAVDFIVCRVEANNIGEAIGEAQDYAMSQCKADYEDWDDYEIEDYDFEEIMVLEGHPTILSAGC